MAKKIENMSDKELMDAWTQAGGDLIAAREKVKALSNEFHQREAVKSAAARLNIDLENANDEQRAALRQLATAQGVESEEKVGADQ